MRLSVPALNQTDAEQPTSSIDSALNNNLLAPNPSNPLIKFQILMNPSSNLMMFILPHLRHYEVINNQNFDLLLIHNHLPVNEKSQAMQFLEAI